MTKGKPRTQGPTSKFQPKPLDEDLFFQLYDILYDGCFEGNNRATARTLGVSLPTVKKWLVTAPKDPWMNHVLHAAIIEVYQTMLHSKHKKIRKRAEKVRGQLHRSDLHGLKDQLEWNEHNNADVQRALLARLWKTPDGAMSLRELRRPGNIGAYSERAIRTAADATGLIRETTGFGKDKDTLYRVPTDEDLT